MVDIHNHILFGIDDGAKNTEEALEMARTAAANGITDIIATPHHKIGVYENYGPKIIELTDQVNNLIRSHQIPVTVHPSQEIRIYGDVIADLKTGKALPLMKDAPYVLIELPTQEVPVYTEQLFTNMALEGYVPVIAHPERNSELQKNPNKLASLIELGALCQVTAGVVVGRLGDYSQSVAQQMMKHKMIHFVASDAHNVTGRNFFMDECYEYIEGQYGIDQVNYYKENARKVLNGEKIRYVSPLEVQAGHLERQKKKKKFLGLF
ncbi:tyrosine-protein phosphatase [Macrococcus equipercicus]|uniref:Tyrosine-protein phosphatase n=1 Tax=Macrococcus equipercicus TaxID=69967 RepID=A0A9Q9BVZ6_9STAP|nr:CpsB/CapC family capsule biosynthesis tyrosine phosphatase [Macrococcus equipercicus]KAA1037705.1 tyrosine protein phosphatase [Macrococcus equipercicus]UTH13417.1 tyrosine protein phosphatase [Macrococcus equipercicus]